MGWQTSILNEGDLSNEEIWKWESNVVFVYIQDFSLTNTENHTIYRVLSNWKDTQV